MKKMNREMIVHFNDLKRDLFNLMPKCSAICNCMECENRPYCSQIAHSVSKIWIDLQEGWKAGCLLENDYDESEND